MTESVVKSVCPKDCPDTCGMLTHVEDGRVVRVAGDPDHPITNGWLCGRYQHYEDLVNHADRLLHPLARASKRAPLERVTWNDALELIAGRLQTIIAERGPEAILPYHYLANMGVVATGAANRLWNRMGTSRVGMEICAMAGAEAVLRVFGTIRGTEPQHLDKTRLYVAWGKNPRATNVHGHALTHHVRPRIVVDPRRSETAVSADVHIRPRPGTDSLLAIGLMRILIENDWVDHEFLSTCTIGYEPLREAVMTRSLAEVVDATGVSGTEIERFAALYHEHRPGLIHLGVGLQRNTNGGEMIATVAMLGALTGQIGTPGGGVLYANFAYDWADISHPELRADAPRFYNMVTLGRDLTETDEIQALYVYNSNPAATSPNQTLVKRGLERDDLFVVVHDLFLTDTAQLADVVLPATTFAEAPDLHRSYWHDYGQINNPAIEPIGEARSNLDTFNALARAMGYTEPCFDETAEEVIRAALEGTTLDYDALRAGPVACEPPERTSFQDGSFPTASGRLELAVPTFTPPPPSPHRYRFLTPKSKHLQGSQCFNDPRKSAALATPWLYVHPSDAEAEGIRDGDPVAATNERGSVELVTRVSDDVQPGLVVSHMVRWGPNANATTPDGTADLGGNSTFHTNYVSLARR
ncbi:MAG: molybdopterin-dependent oxidoreductase [Gaiellales bacterium]